MHCVWFHYFLPPYGTAQTPFGPFHRPQRSHTVLAMLLNIILPTIINLMPMPARPKSKPVKTERQQRRQQIQVTRCNIFNQLYSSNPTLHRFSGVRYRLAKEARERDCSEIRLRTSTTNHSPIRHSWTISRLLKSDNLLERIAFWRKLDSGAYRACGVHVGG